VSGIGDEGNVYQYLTGRLIDYFHSINKINCHVRRYRKSSVVF
jgi:hypothetical protein